MNDIAQTIAALAEHKDALVEIIVALTKLAAYIVLGASAVIRIVPKLDDGNKLKPIVKIIGKYLAMNRDISKEK